MGVEFTVIVPLLPSHRGFSFVFGCGVSFFGELQCLPVDDCPAASCDYGVLPRGSESTSFYSAILVPPCWGGEVHGFDPFPGSSTCCMVHETNEPKTNKPKTKKKKKKAP